MHGLRISIVIVLLARLQLVNRRWELIIRDSIVALYVDAIHISLLTFLHLAIKSLLDVNQMLQNVFHLVFEFARELFHGLLVFLDFPRP